MIFAACAINTAAAVSPGGTNQHAAPRLPIVRINDDDDDGYRYRRYHRRGRVVDASYTHVELRGPVIVDAPFTHVAAAFASWRRSSTCRSHT